MNYLYLGDCYDVLKHDIKTFMKQVLALDL